MSSYLHHGNLAWANETDKRIVAASLVQGAYDLEHGRRSNNNHVIEKAKSLVKSFGFEIFRPIEDAEDKSYCGAIFKYINELPNRNLETSPPQYVIAFRGTCLNPETRQQDIKLDLNFVFHQLHEKPRSEVAFNVVEEIIAKSGGPKNVWLAGHSLGSAIALIVGRNMVIRKGIYLNTYLFSPPFFSFSTHTPFSIAYWFFRSGITAGMDKLLRKLNKNNKDKDEDEVFNKLRSWSPHLFVNKRDYVSSGYIWYFRQRKIMDMIGAGRIEDVATQKSVISSLGEVLDIDFEPIHLIPSAYLTKAKGSTFSPFKSHGIKQWQRDLPTKTKSYVWKIITE